MGLTIAESEKEKKRDRKLMMKRENAPEKSHKPSSLLEGSHSENEDEDENSEEKACSAEGSHNTFEMQGLNLSLN